LGFEKTANFFNQLTTTEFQVACVCVWPMCRENAGAIHIRAIHMMDQGIAGRLSFAPGKTRLAFDMSV
jgi:hypothetical protein